MKPDNFNYNWTNKVIIIADSIELSYSFTKSLLAETNCTQFWIKNGLDLINYCQENDSSYLILVEARLPIFDGIEATKIIKQIKPHIPIIAYTTFDDKDSFIKAGCNAYLQKPTCIEIVYNTINSFLE